MHTLRKPELITEITEATRGLPPYLDGPQVDYTDATTAYATEIVLTHNRLSFLEGHFTPNTEVLLTKQGANRGEQSETWGAISGYIDMPPTFAQQHDPVAHAVRQELAEEAGVFDLSSIVFELGRRCERYYLLPSGEKSIHHIITVLGICGDKPPITPDNEEITAAQWVRLGEVPKVEPLTPDYLSQTLPHALAATVIDPSLVLQATGRS